MKHQLLYNLSIKYSPPKINLRDAEILLFEWRIIRNGKISKW